VQFGTQNVMTGSLKTVACKLVKYQVDLMAVQELRWDSSGSEPADDYMFFYANGNANYQLQTGSFIHEGIISTEKGKIH